jgi:hypothetical protein
MKYKGYEIPNKEIDKMMDTLDISLEEACEVYLFDHDLTENEEVEEITKKAAKNRITSTIHGAKGEKKERKPREKKENALKKEIIDAIRYYFSNKDNINFSIEELTVRNDEKYIDFVSNGREFTINLVEHRKKKGE